MFYIEDKIRICLVPNFYSHEDIGSLLKLANKISQDTGVELQNMYYEKVPKSRRYKSVLVVWVNMADAQNNKFKTPENTTVVTNIFNFLYD